MLQVIASGNDNADTDHTKFEKKAKVIEIPIKKRILVVPFNFEGNPILEAIDFMRRRIHTLLVDDDFCVESFFQPAAMSERPVKRFGNP